MSTTTDIHRSDDAVMAACPGDSGACAPDATPARAASTLGDPSEDDLFRAPMWIDRIEQRISSGIDNLQHPGYLMVAGVAACVLLLSMFAIVVSGQVERGQLRSMEEAAVRAELWRCSALSGASADRCRQIARGETPASPLASWDSLPPVGGAVAGAVVPVSLRP